MLGEGRLSVYDGERPPPADIASSGRVGLSSGHELELRWYVKDSAFVSRGRTGPVGQRRSDDRRGRVPSEARRHLQRLRRPQAWPRTRAVRPRSTACSPTYRKEYDKLDADESPFFDTEKLTNPYADTRICAGDPDTEIRGLLVGIDMEVGEVLLADRLREKGEPIDLVFAHHPEGPGYANLHEVMYMQADLWAEQGVSIAAGDALIAPRAEEIRRRISPVNHYRAIDAATAARPRVAVVPHARRQLRAGVRDRVPRRRAAADARRAVKALRTIPEYADGARKGYGPVDRRRAAARRARVAWSST